MTVDFSKIEVSGIEGKEYTDIRKPLGNYLYYQSTDLIGSELGKRIYFSEADIELTEQEVKIIMEAVNTIYKSYILRQAITAAIS